MNAAELHAAAEKIRKAAKLRTTWAAETTNPVLRSVCLEVARLFSNRADQTWSWARHATYYEQRGEIVPADDARKRDTAVLEFLLMVGNSVDDA